LSGNQVALSMWYRVVRAFSVPNGVLPVGSALILQLYLVIAGDYKMIETRYTSTFVWAFSWPNLCFLSGSGRPPTLSRARSSLAFCITHSCLPSCGWL